VVFIQFLYTRCPLPEVCPRLAASFASLRRRFSSPDLVLVSITLDPRYDSPEVLARYARSAGARPGWHFLTGPEPEIEKIARAFGLVHWAEEGVIVHSSYTAVVGRDQRLRALIEGSSYRLEQLAALAQHILKEP
jgi:protein SCO1/2